MKTLTRERSAQRKRQLMIAGFLLPSLAALAIFTYYPIIDAFRLSFHRDGAWHTMEYVGLGNYFHFFSNPIFWQVVWNNVVFLVATIFPTMALALLCAILINEVVRGKAFYRLALFYPLLVPFAAAAMVWVFMYDPGIGPINRLLGLLGLPRPGWLGDRNYSLWSLVIMNVWRHFGYFMLIYLAGLQAVPRALYDASKCDGANWFSMHRHVTMPLLGPSHLFVFVVSIIQSFQVFTQVFMMTEGGPGYSSSVLIFYTWEHGFKFWQLGRAGALTSIMILAILLLVLVVFGIVGRRISYEIS